MRGRRAFPLWCGAVGALWLVFAPVGAGAAGSAPTVALSTTTLVPGQTVVLSGSHWPDFDSVVATLCGSDAVSGTADCAVTETATMVATHRGLLWSHIAVEVPPQPCPCVLYVTSATSAFSEKIPVKIQGAPSAPVRTLTPSRKDTPVISDLAVSSSWSLASSFGAPATKTVTLRLENPGQTTITPVLVGRWGSGQDTPYVITMPRLRPLGPGRAVTVRTNFQLKAFAIGTYRVAVSVQSVGLAHEVSASASTTQWPVALFVCLGLLAGLVVWVALAARRRRRARRRADDDEARGLGDLAALGTAERLDGDEGTEDHDRLAAQGSAGSGSRADGGSEQVGAS